MVDLQGCIISKETFFEYEANILNTTRGVDCQPTYTAISWYYLTIILH